MSAGDKKLAFAMVCASNMNRSMEGHRVLKEAGMNVESFGTGTNVKLPGRTATTPNVYEFGTPYSTIFEELKAQDEQLYIHNGVLQMLDRNRKIKTAPQRFQDYRESFFDLIVTFEERVFDAVVEELSERESVTNEPVYVINLDVKDNHEDAAIGGVVALKLCQTLQETSGDEWDDAISEFEAQNRQKLLVHTAFN